MVCCNCVIASAQIHTHQNEHIDDSLFVELFFISSFSPFSSLCFVIVYMNWMLINIMFQNKPVSFGERACSWRSFDSISSESGCLVRSLVFAGLPSNCMRSGENVYSYLWRSSACGSVCCWCVTCIWFFRWIELPLFVLFAISFDLFFPKRKGKRARENREKKYG